MPDTPFIKERLNNGLTVVVEVMPRTRSAACGILVRAGSRDEPPGLAGVSHFLEHLCFKGTPRRTAEQLNVAFDEIGAENNAHTGKDQTFYHSWARAEDLERQIELLTDMMRSTLPPDEFEIEKQVVLEEIASSRDDLLSTVYDLLYERICAGHPLAWPVLGYVDTIEPMTRAQVHDYFKCHYRPSNAILAVAGRVDPDHVLAVCRRWCEDWENDDQPLPPRRPPELRCGDAVQRTDRFHQQVVALAFPSAPVTHPADESAEALAMILGGTNSRFYWNIVQKGLATRAGVTREEYADCGLMIAYAMCEPDNAGAVFEAMRLELNEITAHGPEPKELQRVRNLRRTLLAGEAESPAYRVGQLADDMDYYGAPRSSEARLAEVDAVSAESIGQYLSEFPMTGEGFLVRVGPES